MFINIQILVLSILAAQEIAAYSSGFYLDNGVDQTIRDRVLSKREQLQMQNELLNLLGLPHRPRDNKHFSNHSHKIDKKGSAPKFLLDVYRSLLDEQETKKKTKSEFELSGEDLHAIHESDVIMSFVSHSAPKGALRHQKGHRLWFDVSQVPVGESIVAAELRVFRRHIENAKHHNDKYSILLSQLYHRPEGEGLRKLVELPIDASHEGWLLFNVTAPLHDWVDSADSNLGLMLSVTHHHSGHDIKPEEAGLVTPHTKSSEKQPFMVAFFKSGPHTPPTTLPVSVLPHPMQDNDDQDNELEGGSTDDEEINELEHSRPRRDTKPKKKSADMSHAPLDSTQRKTIFTDPAPNWPGTSCQMKTMYVSFADLGWKNWIIAPDGYAAFYCAGECNFPLTSHMNATNHAIVQTLVHLMKPKAVPKPCCAPLRLSAISVLYYLDASSNVILKQYKNMVVKSCGCH